ncbi:MAG: DUF2752 domain-containing protein [Clostridiales bacterium]|nr:MAG: DUF2752 domain-containing protein [Clostridiales bacterium]
MLKKRLKKAALFVPLLFVLGLVGVWLSETGHGIPCIFHVVTGLQCPGCGVTRMLSALLHGDWRGAWESNAAVLTLSPVLAGLVGLSLVRWIRTGSARLPRWADAVTVVCVVLLLLFTVARNLPAFL